MPDLQLQFYYKRSNSGRAKGKKCKGEGYVSVLGTRRGSCPLEVRDPEPSGAWICLPTRQLSESYHPEFLLRFGYPDTTDEINHCPLVPEPNLSSPVLPGNQGVGLRVPVLYSCAWSFGHDRHALETV